jgi:hypothetical protein
MPLLLSTHPLTYLSDGPDLESLEQLVVGLAVHIFEVRLAEGLGVERLRDSRVGNSRVK